MGRGTGARGGLLGVDLMQAMQEAERVALTTFGGIRDGNELEEVKIKEADFMMLRDQLKIEERSASGETIARTAGH